MVRFDRTTLGVMSPARLRCATSSCWITNSRVSTTHMDHMSKNRPLNFILVNIRNCYSVTILSFATTPHTRDLLPSLAIPHSHFTPYPLQRVRGQKARALMRFFFVASVSKEACCLGSETQSLRTTEHSQTQFSQVGAASLHRLESPLPQTNSSSRPLYLLGWLAVAIRLFVILQLLLVTLL